MSFKKIYNEITVSLIHLLQLRLSIWLDKLVKRFIESANQVRPLINKLSKSNPCATSSPSLPLTRFETKGTKKTNAKAKFKKKDRVFLKRFLYCFIMILERVYDRLV